MKNNTLSTLLISLLAALAFILPLSNVGTSPVLNPAVASATPSNLPTTPTSPAPSDIKSDKKNPGQIPGESARLLCDFLGQSMVGMKDSAKPTTVPGDVKGDYCRLNRGLKLSLEMEFLVATVPDPKDTRLDNTFDQSIDAVQRAAEAAGYVLDRHWLPWDRSKTPVAATPATQLASSAVSRQTLDPGVLLFRNFGFRLDAEGKPMLDTLGKNNPLQREDSLLMIFLVGETPTYGIHKIAFQNALEQIEQLSALVKPKSSFSACDLEGPHIRILGPTFSGSATSLALSVKGWLERPKAASAKLNKACIISGTATAIKKKEFLNLIGERHKNDVNIFGTVIPEETSRNAFLQDLVNVNKPLFLKQPSLILPTETENDIDRTYIVLLKEGTTSYGQRAGEETREKNTQTLKSVGDLLERNRQRQSGTSLSPHATPTPEPRPLILTLTFPLHISQLRIEASKGKAGKQDSANTILPKDSNLALPMSDPGDPKHKDVVQPYSTTDAVTTELVLSELLLSIHRERIKYVGLTATDVLDRIFLIREVRQHCPNSVIFVFNSDLLYLHSEVNVDAQGVLVITPYPLFAQNQIWTFPFEGSQTRLQFTTQTAQGVYNATLALLGKPKLMLEYGKPFFNYPPDSYRDRQPVLWVGIVGRNGIWPIKTLGYQDDEDYVWPPIQSKANYDESETDQALLAPQLGLIRAYYSPFGLGFLMLIGVACLCLSVVMLAGLLLFKLGFDDNLAEKHSKREAKTGGRIRSSLRRIVATKSFSRLARIIKRGRISQTFGDEEFYQYRFMRRIYLMACCTGLLTVAMFTSGVSALPDWMKIEAAIPSKSLWQHQIITLLSYVTLLFVFLAFIWLFLSLGQWFFGGPRSSKIRLRARRGLRRCCDFSFLFRQRGFAGRKIWLCFLHMGKWVFGGRENLRGGTLAVLSLITGLTMIILALNGMKEVFLNYEEQEKVFFFVRTTEIASGVSLMTPLTLIGLAAFLTFFSGVRRINLAERMACLPKPQDEPINVPAFLHFDHERTTSFSGISHLERKVKLFLVGRGSFFIGMFLVTLVIFLIYWLLFLMPYTPSVDGKRFDLFFKVMFFLVPLLLIWTFVRFILTWVSLQKLLRRLAWHPLFAVFATERREDKQLNSLPHIDLLSPSASSNALSLSLHQAKRFLREITVPAHKQDSLESLVEVKQLVEEAESTLAEALQAESIGNWQSSLQLRRTGEETICKLSKYISALLEPTWKWPAGKEVSAWQDEGKFFLLAHTATFLQHILAHLQNLVALVTGGLVLVLLASTSYPFQPRQPLLMFSWVAILTVATLTLLVFAQMSRDKVLSLLSGTTPGKLNFNRDFLFRVLIHGVIPVIALLGAQFPETLRQFFSWLSVFQGSGR